MQQWTIEEISIFSNSSHLEWRAELLDTIWNGTHPGTIHEFMLIFAYLMLIFVTILFGIIMFVYSYFCYYFVWYYKA
jgi:vacuolar-type H+-ATPase subunit I/STV1